MTSKLNDQDHLMSRSVETIHMPRNDSFAPSSGLTNHPDGNNQSYYSSMDDKYDSGFELWRKAYMPLKMGNDVSKFKGLKLQALKLEKKITYDVHHGIKSSWQRSNDEPTFIGAKAERVIKDKYLKPTNPYELEEKNRRQNETNIYNLNTNKTKLKSLSDQSTRLSAERLPISISMSPSKYLTSDSYQVRRNELKMPELPINDPLHRIFEEEYNKMMNYRDNDSPSAYLEPITRSEIKSLSHFESPPPELWIIGRIAFVVIVLFFFEYEKNCISDRTDQSNEYDHLMQAEDVHELSNAKDENAAESSHLCEISKIYGSNGIFRLLSNHFSTINIHQPMRTNDILEQFSWTFFKSILQQEKDFVNLINRLDSSSKYSDTNHDDFISLNILHFASPINQPNQSNRSNFNGSRSFETIFYSNLQESDIDTIRSISRPRTFHPDSCTYFSKPAAHLCAIVRRIVAKIYHVSIHKAAAISKYVTVNAAESDVSKQPQASQDAAVNHTNPLQLLEELRSSHAGKKVSAADLRDSIGSWIANWEIFPGTSRQRWQQLLSYPTVDMSQDNAISPDKAVEGEYYPMRYVFCLDNSITSIEMSQSIICLASSFSNVDILVCRDILETGNEYDHSDHANQMIRMNAAIQTLSSSPIHRVYDAAVYTKEFQSMIEENKRLMRGQISSSYQQEDNANDIPRKDEQDGQSVTASFSAIAYKINSKPKRLDSEISPEKHNNSRPYRISVKDVVNYHIFLAKADIMVLPLSYYTFTEDPATESSTSSIHDQEKDPKRNAIESLEKDRPNTALTTELYTSRGRQRHQTIENLMLLSKCSSNISFPKKYVVCVTDSPNSIAAYKLITSIIKPGDTVIALHIPLPSIDDMIYISSLDKKDNSLEWSDIRLGKALIDRIKGRSNRLSKLYQSLGCNLLIGDAIDSLELIQLYHKTVNNGSKKEYHQVVTNRMIMEINELSPHFTVFGASRNEIHFIAKVGLNRLLFENRPIYKAHSTVSFSLLETITDCSVIIASDKNN